MKTIFSLLCALLAGYAVAAAATSAAPHAAAINGWFDDFLLLVNRARDAIEPLVGLAIAVVIAQNYVTLRRQKVAKEERAVISDKLNSQDAVMAEMHQKVEAVKAQVAPEPVTEQPKDFAP